MDLPRSNEQQTQFNDWITQFSIPCQKKKKKKCRIALVMLHNCNSSQDLATVFILFSALSTCNMKIYGPWEGALIQGEP